MDIAHLQLWIGACNAMKRTFGLGLATTTLLLGLGGAIASQADGTISSVDLGKHEVTLDNGHTFSFPDTVDLTSLKARERARIDYRMDNGRSEATAIEAHGAEVFGKVLAVDAARHMVTLENGHPFIFPETVDLAPVKPGELVRISYSMDGGKSTATSIVALLPDTF